MTAPTQSPTSGPETDAEFVARMREEARALKTDEMVLEIKDFDHLMVLASRSLNQDTGAETDAAWINEVEAAVAETGKLAGAAATFNIKRLIALARRALNREAGADGMRTAASVALASIDSLISESYGVTGLHQNGDVAPWEEILDAERFQWLELAPLRDALARVYADPGNPAAPSPDAGEILRELVAIHERPAILGPIEFHIEQDAKRKSAWARARAWVEESGK